MFAAAAATGVAAVVLLRSVHCLVKGTWNTGKEGPKANAVEVGKRQGRLRPAERNEQILPFACVPLFPGALGPRCRLSCPRRASGPRGPASCSQEGRRLPSSESEKRPGNKRELPASSSAALRSPGPILGRRLGKMAQAAPPAGPRGDRWGRRLRWARGTKRAK